MNYTRFRPYDSMPVHIFAAPRKLRPVRAIFPLRHGEFADYL
jgi:hypothetical protein